MTFALPEWPGFTDMEPFEISRNVEPEVVLNGEQQRFLRLGGRMGIKCTLPPMEIEDARLWVAALMRASREPVTLEWPQPGLVNPLGACTVAAASSANATVLAVAGIAGEEAALGGQWFNHVKPGEPRRLYAVVQTGTTPLIIAPPLRAPAEVGEVLDFDTVKIEGLVDGPATWSVNAVAHYGAVITIRETK